MKSIYRTTTICLSAFFLASLALAQPATMSPERVGMSTERLTRVNQLLDGYIESGKLIGASTMISRKGSVVHSHQYGVIDAESGEAVTPNTLFRIYSMTKPIASVSALILYEEGHFQLNDPVSKYLPEFANSMVYDASVPGMRRKPTRPISIRDLLTHQAGLSYGFFSNTPVDSLYRINGPLGSRDNGLGPWVTALADLPLLHDPGTTWHYSFATDVVGRLVEVVSGKTFDVFLKERIFEPLGMESTRFDVAPEDLDRFMTTYQFNRETGVLDVSDRGSESTFAAPVVFFSGGGGLISTQADYMRFAQMLLNGGELDGRRVLGRKTVELMTMSHLGDRQHEPGWGFGLGVQVLQDVAQVQVSGSEGTYGWSGLANTHFFVDPEEELIGMVWTQILPYGLHPVASQFKVAVYQAIVD